MEGKTLKEIRRIKRRFATQYGNAIDGIGIGRDDAGNYCLRAYLATEDDDRSGIPTEFEGVKVVIVVPGEIHAQKR